MASTYFLTFLVKKGSLCKPETRKKAGFVIKLYDDISFFMGRSEIENSQVVFREYYVIIEQLFQFVKTAFLIVVHKLLC